VLFRTESVLQSKRPSWLFALCLVAAFHVLWEGHGVLFPKFHNLDVAGIVYNARLFLGGKLPYVDSADFKPPGAFLMVAPALAFDGLRAVWALSVFAGVATSLAVGALAAACFGRAYGPRAAVLHAALSVLASDADINYGFWMTLPFALSAACAASALRANGARFAWLWFFAGALSALAVATKPSASVLLILFGVHAWLERGSFRRVSVIVTAGVSGALVVVLLVAAPYAWAGELAALVSGVRRTSEFGKEYVAVVEQASGGRLNAALRGAQCWLEQIPSLVALGLLGLLPWPWRSRGSRGSRYGFLSLVFLGCSLLGVTMTLRFYSHDNVQLWPALAVLAVRPGGVLDALANGFARRLRPEWAFAVVGLVALAPGLRQRFDFASFTGERDSMVSEICGKVSDVLAPNTPVLAWGWHAWGVYERCGRLAPGRVYKTIGSVTTVNTNTCNCGFGPMKPRPGREADEFVHDLVARPPGLVLWSTYYIENGGDPLDEWPEVSDFIDEHYRIVRVEGPFIALLRNDLGSKPTL
jgi:hypothetical protein